MRYNRSNRRAEETETTLFTSVLWEKIELLHELSGMLNRTHPHSDETEVKNIFLYHWEHVDCGTLLVFISGSRCKRHEHEQNKTPKDDVHKPQEADDLKQS